MLTNALVAAGAISAGLTGVLADAAPEGGALPSEISLLIPYLNLGVIVVLVIMAATKKGFIPKWVLDDQEKTSAASLDELKRAHAAELAAVAARADAAEKRESEYKQLNADLQTYQRDQLQPALIETTRVVSAYVSALAKRGGSVDG